ncbi:enoyl-ACP reductase FabI [Hugenholtzia roseola]|uniref:enoyl-ACP reductase FabI n=1 Tax=Hugenholtzia roseola TaxID=1002 RepID=UPI00047B6269|nr:enoyl-ACP reductase [Hugenholtzia roseola]
MYNLLKGKRGIITGALDEKSIAWKIAQRAHAEGATFTLTNAPVAMRMGTIQKLAQECNTIVIPADATSLEDIENLYQKSVEHLGGKIDFILHSIGMSPNVRKKKDYGDLNYQWFMQALDISAVSFHKMMQVAEKKDILNEEASIVALSYIAAQRTFPDYGDMAQAKALLESIARSYGYRLGMSKKARVNTVSQSPTPTTAGTGVGGFDAFLEYADKLSPLGNASADECADYVITLFSDLTKKVTMQNLYHDGGFSTMGVSEALMNKM